MDIKKFDYQLPNKLIAQFPTQKRDESRLMVLNRISGEIEIHPFKDILNYLSEGDALVINNTKVFKARLIGNRESGAEVEIFLVRRNLESQEEIWECLARPSRRLKENERICFEKYSLELLKNLGEGRWQIRFDSTNQREKIISKFGHVPLPQYIKRTDATSDIRRYQTLFADKEKVGAVAAPTAGFHFTKPIIDSLNSKGVKIVQTTLHVGPGTFKPVSVDNIHDHSVDPEMAELTKSATDTINKVRQNKGKIFAVGTTSVRNIESAPFVSNMIQPHSGLVNLYIKPGYKFKVVDHLVTNFHLPKSSLLILISAFAGREKIIEAYEQAIKNEMRFYSYGDAMLIL